MNKRAHYRFNLNLDIKYRVLESLKDYGHTLSEDVSEKGMRISLPEYIPPQTWLELIIKIPEENEPVVAVGKVVWIKKTLFGKSYNAGIHFGHLTESSKKNLYKYALL